MAIDYNKIASNLNTKVLFLFEVLHRLQAYVFYDKQDFSTIVIYCKNLKQICL